VGAVRYEYDVIVKKLARPTKPRRGSLVFRGMNALKAHVENGRIIVDEPTDLPDGTVLHVVPVSDGMDAEERAALEQSIEEGYEDFEKGDVEDAFGHLARIRSEGEDRDRRPSPRSGGTRT
jgi:hypothetical protein